jgi:hypothetical protein
LLKKPQLLRCPHPSSLRRTSAYASFLGISGALYLIGFRMEASKRSSAKPSGTFLSNL